MSEVRPGESLDQRIERFAVDALYKAREDGKVMDEAAKEVAHVVQAQVLAGVRERLTMEAAEGLVQAYATGGAEAFATEVRALLGEGE